MHCARVTSWYAPRLTRPAWPPTGGRPSRPTVRRPADTDPATVSLMPRPSRTQPSARPCGPAPGWAAGSSSRLTADVDQVLHLEAVDDLQACRTASIHALLAPRAPAERNPTPRAYALAHHFLEGAEAAARARDVEAFVWYTTAVGRGLVELQVDTPIGPAVVVG